MFCWFWGALLTVFLISFDWVWNLIDGVCSFVVMMIVLENNYVWRIAIVYIALSNTFSWSLSVSRCSSLTRPSNSWCLSFFFLWWWYVGRSWARWPIYCAMITNHMTSAPWASLWCGSIMPSPASLCMPSMTCTALLFACFLHEIDWRRLTAGELTLLVQGHRRSLAVTWLTAHWVSLSVSVLQ